ncbi:MAG: ADP-ribosylglycohydrolase family protein [Anaerolineae bacterium]|nr:ADP-ribosylglycohydrolase family protein [Anaerolineae bacterium]
MTSQRASGCLFGLAFGDALGAPTEFLSYSEIKARYGTYHSLMLKGDPAYVTDDTQMALAVAKALRRAETPYSQATLLDPLRNAFIEWLDSPDNNRAPGNTCLDACYALQDGQPWYKASVQGSKGCGANMRVAPVGILPAGEHGFDETARAGMAQFQAALTHGHPTGLAAADLTAAAIADLVQGGTPTGLVARLTEYARSQRQIWHAAWLDPLLSVRPVAVDSKEFIAYGWDECLRVLDRLAWAVENADRDSDPCKATGAGWIAEEAFATGLLCFLLFPNEPTDAVRFAAMTSGDSDSIACLTGAFAGSYHGLSAWPADWISRIEYADQLTAFGAYWDRG